MKDKVVINGHVFVRQKSVKKKVVGTVESQAKRVIDWFGKNTKYGLVERKKGQYERKNGLTVPCEYLTFSNGTVMCVTANRQWKAR